YFADDQFVSRVIIKVPTSRNSDAHWHHEPGRDAFHRVPHLDRKIRDAVERVPTGTYSRGPLKFSDTLPMFVLRRGQHRTGKHVKTKSKGHMKRSTPKRTLAQLDKIISAWELNDDFKMNKDVTLASLKALRSRLD